MMASYPWPTPFGTTNWLVPSFSWPATTLNVLWKTTCPSPFMEKRASWTVTLWFSPPRYAGSHVIRTWLCSDHFFAICRTTAGLNLTMLTGKEKKSIKTDLHIPESDQVLGKDTSRLKNSDAPSIKKLYTYTWIRWIVSYGHVTIQNSESPELLTNGGGIVMLQDWHARKVLETL